ncbi:uncharacterized protein [Bombus flavifrons]|uniref:uncharacterized protein n=1 Tax=Bombus flavifrons TaxID=103934 RepID=UPI003704633C
MAPNQEERIKQLKQKREVIKQELVRFRTILDNYEARGSLNTVHFMLEDLEAEYTIYEKRQCDLDVIDDGQKIQERLDIKQEFLDCKGRATDIIERAKGRSIDAIDTDCTRLMYLRSCLTREAADSIASLANTASNYSVAWELLEIGYNQPTKIMDDHLQALFDASPLQRPSYQDIRSYLNQIEAHYKALQALKQPTVDTVLLYLLTSKLDPETQVRWKKGIEHTPFPSVGELFNFLNGHCKVLEATRSTYQNPSRTTTYPDRARVQQPRASPEQTIRVRQRAPWKHVFTAIQVIPAYPTSCRLMSDVRRTTPHDATSGKAAVEVEFLHLRPKFLLVKQENSITPVTYNPSSHAIRQTGTDLVPCAPRHRIQHELHHRKLANTLGIRQKKSSVPIGDLDTLTTTSRRFIRATITSIDGKYERTLTFLVIPAITKLIPSQPIDRSALDTPRNIKLADPRFYVSSPIDVLLSSGATFSSMCVGKINPTRPDEPDLRLQKIRFSWVVRGSPTSSTATSTFHASTTALQADPARFWEIDEGPQIKHISEAERRCEEHFRAHARRTSDGLYIVALPFNDRLPSLVSSKAQAMKRLVSLNRRFQRDSRFEADYRAALQDYLDRGHMSGISPDDTDEGRYYLPHHAVINAASETTKLRVVCDGSAASCTRVSLNDTLYIGIKLQEDLFNILLRFRLHQYVLIGDIEKMYRQFLVRPEDRRYQKTDESLPADLHYEWNRYYTQLSLLNEIRFPRKTITKTPIEIELHGFCNASERAYGACVYLRSIDHHGNVQTRLLTAKSKVAPLKTQTIPRLGLSGALLLTSLSTIIQQAVQVKANRTVYWTDSTIVLQWINSSPHTLKTFVANRIAEIQNKTSFTDFRHSPNKDNPADLISRGQSTEDYLQPNIWQTVPR